MKLIDFMGTLPAEVTNNLGKYRLLLIGADPYDYGLSRIDGYIQALTDMGAVNKTTAHYIREWVYGKVSANEVIIDEEVKE